jgi:BASS family bile acid:Na+ symporter
MGLILMGLSPCAPFLPMLVKKAHGDLGYTAAFMLIASIGTVFFMPFAVPLLVKGLTVSSWTIAKPLLITLLIPLISGMAILRHSQLLAQKIIPTVKKVILVFTISTLVFSVLVYGKGLFQIDAINVLAALIILFGTITFLSYLLASGLESNQKIVLSMGVTTRNIGASVAPLLSLPVVDEKTIVIIVLGAPVMIGAALLHARFMHRSKN